MSLREMWWNVGKEGSESRKEEKGGRTRFFSMPHLLDTNSLNTTPRLTFTLFQPLQSFFQLFLKDLVPCMGQLSDGSFFHTCT